MKTKTFIQKRFTKPTHILPFNYCCSFTVFSFVFLLFVSCRKIISLNETTVSSKGSNQLAAKPNIIFILADDVGYEIPTCNGGESYSTPNIDFLSKNGMRFSQCYSLPMCSPSRIQIVTGKYSFRNYTRWGTLDTTQRTFANMLHGVGYNTCYAGKWELDGGDSSLHKFGFDKYRVWLPYNKNEDEECKYRYKNPHLYENRKFLSASQTAGQYADDMFANYILKFIDSNLAKPFFVMYATSLVHAPFGPTPDDPEFATWDYTIMPSEKKFFPSMIKYMDKEIQKIIDGLNSRGLLNNTVIVFAGDNGTPYSIVSLFQGQEIQGGKSTTTVYGTHVPLIVRWSGTVPPGSVSNALIDFSDFLPTFADIAQAAAPTNYGKLDGVSFVPALNGSNTNLRNWIFGSWMSANHTDHAWVKWVQNRRYKLYDSVYQNDFFNIVNDPLEQSPITQANLTSDELTIRNKFTNTLKIMH
jgi:arylsulfatase A